MFGLYIHIPFCKKICDYCDFRVISVNPKLFQEYSDLLCREIECFETCHPGLLETAETLYLGGGTPSILPADCLRQIFDCLKSVGVQVEKLREVSMEFNPESTSSQTIENAISLGVGRFSLGLQTFDSEMLKRIGRSHSVESGIAALELLLKYPEIRVSADLMFNLPEQTVESFLQDVNRLSDYPLNHISFYGLTVNPRSVLGKKVEKEIFHLDDNLYEPMYEGGVQLLEGKGIKRYEVSNFARLGFESVHNRNYWKRGEYAGFGPGAHSYVGNTRFYAPEMYPRWREYVRMNCPDSSVTKDVLNEDDILMEIFWLSLRQSAGLDLQMLEKTGWKLPEKNIVKWLDRGYLVADFSNGSYKNITLCGRGWIFMDEVVTDLVNGCSKLE